MSSKITITLLDSASEILSVLNEAKSYIDKADGVDPRIRYAMAILCNKPKLLHHYQKITFGIYKKKELIGFSDILIGYPDKHTIYIGLLLFKEKYQGKGYGKAFIKELFTLCKALGFTVVKAAIIDANIEVKDFWIKMGFHSTGKKSKFYSEQVESMAEVYQIRLDDQE